ncbi:PP2C family protein-serine/threonine phosphatase [Ruania halotolerans]|uniref:PP2C family protein-serine/threonine phosphatase n=1 Tax=Ruania halotolerans TaxID=2897773 RepID=UPI001E31F94D|nr:protein phosphatase 2C domain-containing protein [Ruania halotolerans]UFU04931.1 protein phosphatase 2C domain-containing protein [Ruania halotolerans]
MNEDAVLARPPLFLVADGMGGHIHGEIASAAVVRAFEEFVGEFDPDQEVRPDQVQQAIRTAQNRMRAALQGQAEPQAEPVTAGSTVAGALITVHEGAPFWLVFNVGDSRVYRYSDETLTQISVDHSLVQELIESGAIDHVTAREHPQRNVITRAVDTNSDAEADFWRLHAGARDRLVICSDGLTGELTDAAIAAVLAAEPAATAAAERLLNDALTGGARDNVSVIVVDLEGADVSMTAPRARADDDVADTVPRGNRLSQGRDASS